MTHRLPQVVRLNTVIRLATATVLAAFTAAGAVPMSIAGAVPIAADGPGYVTLTAAPPLVDGGAQGALVALPRDATGGRAWVADRVGAQAAAVPGRVMIMRGRPVLLARAEAAADQAPVMLQVAHDGNWEAEAPDHRLASPALDAALGGLPAGKAATVSQGSYVIVYDAALAAAVAPLALTPRGDTVRFYPNPTQGVVTISGLNEAEYAEVTVADGMGKEVFRTSGESSIDLSSLPGGMYLVTIRTDRGVLVGKLIKE